MDSATSPLSLRNGVRVASPPGCSVEQVLLAIGERVGHGNISYASRMNKALVVFLANQEHVSNLIGSGLTLDGGFVPVSPLAVPSTRVTVSAVPPFIPNELLERELRRFGKFASGFKSVGLGCRDEKLQHVQSLRRQVFMYLETPTLDISFRVKHGDAYYMVYASSGNLKCFECGDTGHKRVACPHRQAVPLPDPMEGNSGVGAELAGSQPEPAQRSYAGALMSAAAAAPVMASSAAVEQAVEIEDNSEAAMLMSAAAPTSASSAAVKRAAEIEGTAGMETAAVSAQTSAAGSDAAAPRLECAGTPEPGRGKKRKIKKKSGTAKGETNVFNSDSSDSERDRATNSKADCTQTAAMETDGDIDSDSVSAADSASQKSDMYSLQEITDFLDETFGQSVEVTDYFPDIVKFIQSVSNHQKTAGADELDERKRYRLAKHVATLRKRLKVKKMSSKVKGL